MAYLLIYNSWCHWRWDRANCGKWEYIPRETVKFVFATHNAGLLKIRNWAYARALYVPLFTTALDQSESDKFTKSGKKIISFNWYFSGSFSVPVQLTVLLRHLPVCFVRESSPCSHQRSKLTSESPYQRFIPGLFTSIIAQP